MRRGRLRLATAVVALLLGAVAAEGLAAARSVVPAVELHLDSLSSGTTADSSGNNLSATAQGTLVADGRFDHALRMDAAGNAVNVANHPLLAPAQVTVMAWVRQSGYSFDQFLVGKPHPALGCNSDSYALTSGLTSGVRFLVVAGGSNATQYSTPESSTASVWDGQWHAIAGTYDGSTVRLYQDGQLVGSKATDGSPIRYDTNPGDTALAGLYSGIPSNPNNCVFSQKYSGDIDEIRVYDHALSAEAIAALHDQGATTPPALTEPPTVLAAPATGVAAEGATLRGTVTPNGSPVTDCHFEYGTSTAYGATVPCAQSVGGGAAGVPVSAAVAGLTGDTGYQFKLVATNGLGTGSDTGTFTTTTPPLTLPLGGEPIGNPPGGALGVDTRILSGPTEVISGAPTFTFDATVAGATFQCWVDAGAPAPCTSPSTRFGLASGKHTFFVKASAGGRGDLTPASWPFTIGTTVRKGGCVDVVIAWVGGATSCTPLRLRCPLGAECTLKGVADELRDKDVGISTQFSVSGRIGTTGDAGTTCNNHPEVLNTGIPLLQSIPYKPCPQEFTLTRIGDGGVAAVGCGVGEFVDRPGEYRAGPDADRLFTCSGELTTKPAEPLHVVGTGTTTPATIVTGPGKLTLTGGAAAAGKARVVAARKRVAPIRPLRVTANAAGPVQLPFKLGPAAKKVLKRTGRLSVRLAVSFKPAGTTQAIVRRQRFTFTTAPKPIKPRRRRPSSR